LFYSQSITSTSFHSVWPTGVELCSSTSDRKHFTRTSEASTSRKRKPAIEMHDEYPDGAGLELMSLWMQA